MRIAVAQVNPTVSDLNGNARLVIERMEKAREKDAQLIIFPEMVLTGYPPRDLLLYEAFIRRVEEIIKYDIMPAAEGLWVLLGAPWREDKEGPLMNSALLIDRDKVISCHHKTLLPNYDVFDENRYFTPSKLRHPATIGGRKVAITICEDIWNDKDFFTRRLYAEDPVAELFEQGAELLVNISASPYNLGKAEKRNEMITSLARKYGAAVIYANQFGGNDELIFDGSSMVCSAAGEIIYQAAPFAEDLFFITDNLMQVEVEGERKGLPGELKEDMEWVLSALVLGLRDYLRKNGFPKVAFGLSGGMDSALLAVIAVKALGPENVLGVMMPSRYSSEHSVEDAKHLARNLGMETRLIPMEGPFSEFMQLLNENGEPLVDLAEENLQSRIRGNILMFISNREGHMILPAGNKSELAVGYCTLYGDMCGGIAPLADLPKTMVYRLAAYINEREGKEIIPRSIMEKPPSAELRPQQKDEDSLPPYEILDPILHYYIEENLFIDQIVEMGYSEETVRDVIRKVDRAEYKRFQAAPGLRITTRAFGSGRRMPLARGDYDINHR